jgi:hypothetical protein
MIYFKMKEFEVIDQFDGKCSYCQEIKTIKRIIIFSEASDEFCSGICRNKYMSQYDKGIKV